MTWNGGVSWNQGTTWDQSLPGWPSSGTYLPGPRIDFEVCFAIGRLAPGAGWDVGTWDLNTWLETATPLGDWVDVTCDVVDGLSLACGTSPDGVVTRWEASTCAFQIRGELWDPRSGPYQGLLGPNLPVRVRWKPSGTPDTAWLVCFRGQTNDDGFTYDPRTRLASLACTDATAILTAFDGVEQFAQGAGETAASRVVRILNTAGWPQDRRDITPGGVTVKSTTLADTAWTLLLQVADTDLALLWVNRAGNLAYRPQGKIHPSSQIGAIIGCGITSPPGGAVPIEPVNITGQQPTITRNIVSVSRQAADSTDTPSTVTVTDGPSVARFLPHSYQRTDLIHQSDAWSTTVANAILATSAWPSTSPASVDLSSIADPAATALLLSVEPSLSILVTDGISTWECEPAGWDVTVGRGAVYGTINLLDVTQWVTFSVAGAAPTTFDAGVTWDQGSTWDASLPADDVAVAA